MCDMACEKMNVLDDVPLPRTMYHMLIELTSKYKHLEEKYDHLTSIRELKSVFDKQLCLAEQIIQT